MSIKITGVVLIVCALSIVLLMGSAYFELGKMATSAGPVAEEDLSTVTGVILALVSDTSDPATSVSPGQIASRFSYVIGGSLLLALLVGGYGVRLLMDAGPRK